MEHIRHRPHSIFYHTGRGVFRALLVVAVPCAVVFHHFHTIENWYEGVSDLPVFEQMQGNFQTGLEVAGVVFRSEKSRFYDPETGQTLPEKHSRRKQTDPPEPAHQTVFWHRQEIENQLLENFPTRKRQSVHAFLDYVDTYRELALLEMRRSKIPASVTLAQGLLESDAGRSFLATQAHNHFGVKCRQLPGRQRDNALTDNDFDGHSLAIDCIQRADDNPWDRFEVYPAADASFRRHSLLLLGDRYAWMIGKYPVGEICPLPRPLFGKTEAPYYAAWSLGLKISGYATSRQYAEKLTLIIETYQLWRIDYEAIIA